MMDHPALNMGGAVNAAPLSQCSNRTKLPYHGNERPNKPVRFTLDGRTFTIRGGWLSLTLEMLIATGPAGIDWRWLLHCRNLPDAIRALRNRYGIAIETRHGTPTTYHLASNVRRIGGDA